MLQFSMCLCILGPKVTKVPGNLRKLLMLVSAELGHLLLYTGFVLDWLEQVTVLVFVALCGAQGGLKSFCRARRFPSGRCEKIHSIVWPI